MNQFPIDPAIFDQCTVMVLGCEAVTDFDTGAQKTDKDNTPKWKLQLLYKAVGARKPEVIEVGFAATDEPQVSHESRPVFKGLVARPWSNENAYGYSSGVAMSAEAVGFREAPSSKRESVAA